MLKVDAIRQGLIPLTDKDVEFYHFTDDEVKAIRALRPEAVAEPETAPAPDPDFFKSLKTKGQRR